jgi:hypothetical protein
MHDVTTHLLLHEARRRDQQRCATDRSRAAHLVRLRRLDRQVERAVTRARLLRLA